LREYEFNPNYKEYASTMKKARAKIESGLLVKTYKEKNPSMGIFILKSMHGFKEAGKEKSEDTDKNDSGISLTAEQLAALSTEELQALQSIGKKLKNKGDT